MSQSPSRDAQSGKKGVIKPLFLSSISQKKAAGKKEKRWEKLAGEVKSKSFFDKLGVPLKPNEEIWQVDMERIITDSWMMENSHLQQLNVDLVPDFFTPRKQVELLEKTSHELNEINNRVTQTLIQYETINAQDDVFQLLDEEDDAQFAAGFDRKSIMEESKGKVKVLIVDYNKLGLKKEQVLGGLREWFDEIKNEEVGEPETEEEERRDEDAVNKLLAGAHVAKEKLVDIHSEIVESLKAQASTSTTEYVPKAGSDAEYFNNVIAKLTKDLEDSMSRLREAEGRAYSIEKMLERKEEELKGYRQGEGAKTSQLREELYAQQQMSQEKESEMGKELARTKAQLEKAQQQLDMWVVEMQARENRMDTLLNLKNMEDEDVKGLQAQTEADRRKLETTVGLLREDVATAELVKQRELEAMRAQKDEEFNERFQKLKLEHREELDKQRANYMDLQKRTREDYEKSMSDEVKKISEAAASPDARVMLDTMKNSYDGRLQTLKDSTAAELKRTREEYEKRLAEVNYDWEVKMQLMMETDEAEQERIRTEGEARVKKEVGELHQRRESQVLGDQIAAQKQLGQLKKQFGTELKELNEHLEKRETQLRDMSSRVDLLNELVQREYNTKPVEAVPDAKKDEPKSNADLEELRTDFLRDKKKAVENAVHKMKIEKDAAVSALQAKFDFEKEAALEDERRKLEKLYRDEHERVTQAILIEKETTVSYLKDEVTIVKQQLEKERNNRLAAGDLADEIRQQKLKYERTIEELKVHYDKLLKQQDQHVQQAIIQAHEQATAALNAISGTSPEPGRSRSNSRSQPLSRGPSVPSMEGAIHPDFQGLETNTEMHEIVASAQETDTKIQILQSKIQQLQTENEFLRQWQKNHLVSEMASRSITDSRADIAASLDTPSGRRPSESRHGSVVPALDSSVLASRRASMAQNNAKNGALGRQERDERLAELKEELTNRNTNPELKLLEAHGRHNAAIKELIELNEARAVEYEKEKETLEMRVAILLVEAEALHKAQSERVAVDAAVSAKQLELQTKADVLDATLIERNELQAKCKLIQDQMIATQGLVSTLDGKKQELESLVKSLEWKLEHSPTDRPGSRQEVEKKLTELEKAVATERTALHTQLQQLEEHLTSERAEAVEKLEHLKSRYEKERENLQKQHDHYMQGIIENFEKRIKGLTEALTACLNDTDLVDELRKDNEESLNNAKLLNEREMSRVRDNMKMLEEEHNLSVNFILAVDRNEIKRMHNTIERLKREFAVLLEEERLMLHEGEERHRDLLEKFVTEFSTESPQSKMPPKTPTDEELKSMIDTEIDTVSKLYNAMSTVLRNRREITKETTREKDAKVGSLQDEMIAKTKALLDTKEMLITQERSLAKLKHDVSNSRFAESVGMADIRATIEEQERIITAFRSKHTANETAMVELIHKYSTQQLLVDDYRRSADQQGATINELQAQTEELQKQVEELQALLAQYRNGAKAPASSRRGSSNPAPATPSPRSPSPPRFTLEEPSPAALSAPSMMLFAAPVAETSLMSAAPMRQPSPSPQKQAPVPPTPVTLIAPVAPSPTRSKPGHMYVAARPPPRNNYRELMNAVTLARPGVQQQRSTARIVETVLENISQEPATDEEEQEKRVRASELVTKDKELRAAQVGLSFRKMTEDLKYNILKQKLIEFQPHDKLQATIARIEERHEKANSRWQQRKQALMDRRQQHFLNVMHAVQDVVNYRAASSIPPAYAVTHGADNSISVSGYPGYVRTEQPLAPGVYSDADLAALLRSSGQQRTLAPSQPDHLSSASEPEHLINFKKYSPFSTGAMDLDNRPREARRGSVYRSSKEMHHLKSLLDSGRVTLGSYDLILWPGIEGRRIGVQAHEEKSAQPTSRSIGTGDAQGSLAEPLPRVHFTRDQQQQQQPTVQEPVQHTERAPSPVPQQRASSPSSRSTTPNSGRGNTPTLPPLERTPSASSRPRALTPTSTTTTLPPIVQPPMEA